MISGSRRRLERRLREERPEADASLVRAIARRVEPRRTGVPRLALGSAMTALMLVALGSVGGISYAANVAKRAAKVVQAAVAPTGPITIEGISAGGDQYRPGYGFGDPNHNHTGPPGLQRSGGEAAPPLRARPVAGGKAKIVRFGVNISEQAALRVHVLAPNGTPLLITQRGSRIGNAVSGPPTKVIRYTVRVPRSIPITLRVPANLLRPGEMHTVRVIATDPDGNRSQLLIPFRG